MFFGAGGELGQYTITNNSDCCFIFLVIFGENIKISVIIHKQIRQVYDHCVSFLSSLAIIASSLYVPSLSFMVFTSHSELHNFFLWCVSNQ
jgi:hypothetical protein